MSNTKLARKLLITKDANDRVIIVDKTAGYSPTERALTSIAESLRMIALVMSGHVAVDMTNIAESVEGKVGPLRNDGPSQTMTDGEVSYVREQIAENTWLRYKVGKGGVRTDAQVIHPNGEVTNVEL